MPKYQIDIEGQGSFEVESDTELTDDQAIQAAQGGGFSNAPSQPQAAAATQAKGFLEATSGRVMEAGQAAMNLPSNIAGIFTGGDEGRLSAGLKTLQGIASPLSILTAPVGGVGEAIAGSVGVPAGWARLAGDISEGVGTLGLGLLAKAGKLGAYGEQLANVLGVGRGTKALDEVLRHDPHMRFALGRDLKESANPLEELARTSSSMEDLAIALKSPQLAANFLEQRKVKGDLWRQWAKEGQLIDEVPEAASYSPSKLLEFQPPPSKDMSIFGTLGTPTNVAARINPQAGQAAYEMALTEMNIKKAISAREVRNTEALKGTSDKDLQRAIWARETLTPEQITSHPNLNQEVKRIISYIDNKYSIDKEIIVPRLREAYKDRLMRQYERQAIKSKSTLDDGTLDIHATEKAHDAIPDNWGLDQYFTHIFPGEYKITDETGKVIGTAKNKLEAKLLLRDLAIDGDNLNLSNLKVTSKSYFDSDLLSQYKGRVGRNLDDIAKGSALSDVEIEAALKGDFGVGGKTKFFGSLLQRQGSQSGYSRDLSAVLQTYDRGIERWMQLTDLSNKVAPTIAELGKRNYAGVANMLENSLQRLWGYHSPVSQYFDNTLQAIPLINKVVAPQALERWTSGLKTGIVNTFLKYNPRFHGVNATQTLSTLWPIVDGSDLAQGTKLLRSDAGKTILQNHGISEIGTRVEGFAKGLGASERLNQNLSFLTMYNKARKLGLSDDQSGSYAKLRGNLYTQFTGLTSDVPYAFSKIDPMGIMTLFQRFPVKQAELLLDVIKDRNFPAAAKWLGVNLALGGFKSATFGQAGWLTYKLYEDVKKEYGEQVADMMHVGLPSLIGVDLSNSVMLYNAPFGKGWAEKVGNIVGGVVGSLASSALGAMAATASPEPSATKRTFDALVSRIPIAKQLDGLRRLFESDYDFKDPLGRLRYKGDVKDAFKQMMGARSTDDANLDTFASGLMEVEDGRRQVLDYAASRYGQAQLTGLGLGKDMEEAIQKEVDNWNTRWPEFPITENEILTRAQRRMQVSTQTLRERLLRAAPRVLRESETFSNQGALEGVLIPGGG